MTNVRELKPGTEHGLSLVRQFTELETAIAACTDTLEQIDLRKRATALMQASGIYKLTELEVSFSILVTRAERSLAASNPGTQGKRNPALDHIEDDTERRRAAWLLSDLRKAHDDLPDDRYEALEKEAREKMTPLTRTWCMMEAHKHRGPDLKVSMKHPFDSFKGTTHEVKIVPFKVHEVEQDPEPKTVRFVVQRDPKELAMEARIAELEAENEQLKERISILLMDDPDRLKTYEGLQTQINTLRSQLANYMEENRRHKAHIKHLKAEVKK